MTKQPVSLLKTHWVVHNWDRNDGFDFLIDELSNVSIEPLTINQLEELASVIWTRNAKALGFISEPYDLIEEVEVVEEKEEIEVKEDRPIEDVLAKFKRIHEIEEIIKEGESIKTDTEEELVEQILEMREKILLYLRENVLVEWLKNVLDRHGIFFRGLLRRELDIRVSSMNLDLFFESFVELRKENLKKESIEFFPSNNFKLINERKIDIDILATELREDNEKLAEDKRKLLILEGT